MKDIETALQKTLGFGAKDFISRAIEGGWTVFGQVKKDSFRIEYGPHGIVVHYHDTPTQKGFFPSQHVRSWDYATVLLDPASWRAVGKVEGWGITEKGSCGKCGYEPRGRGWLLSNPVTCPECRTGRGDYIFFMHRFIDTLTEE